MMGKQITQAVLEKEIRQLRQRGEALQADYNRLRNTVAAIARKHGRPLSLTREDLEGALTEMGKSEKPARLLVTQQPDGSGIVITYAPDGEAPSKEIVRVLKLPFWTMLRLRVLQIFGRA